MKLLRIYACLGDATRLRLLNLLLRGPLCVCHFQAVLREPQAKVSKHLGHLRACGLVTVRRRGNWKIYSLPARRSPALAANLACLDECLAGEPVFRRDLARLGKLVPACVPPVSARRVKGGCAC